MSQAVISDESQVSTTTADEAYLDAIARLYALGQELAPLPPLPDGTPAPPRKWDLAYMRTLCAALGNPQDTFPAVLIAGTNGKGSTSATLASILAAAGYKTGLYTSPHLVRVNERIQILSASPTSVSESKISVIPSEVEGPAFFLPANELSSIANHEKTLSSFDEVGGPASSLPATNTTQISDSNFARIFTRIESTAATLVASNQLPHGPSFFEILTALNFLYFAEQKVDIAILEVGLGGRLDATNIVDPLISVITDIALDHQDYLGNTIAAITREKCGILRLNGTLITLPQHPEANQAIGEAAAMLNLTAISAADFIPSQTPAFPNTLSSFAAGGGPALPDRDSPLPRNRYTLTLDNQLLEVDSLLPGHHQQRNIALAITAAIALRNQSSYKFTRPEETSNQISYIISNAAIEEGIRNTRWPGRLEFIAPNLLLDVAHNPAGAWTLRAAIAQLPESRPRTLIFSCLSDKNLTEISRILFPFFDSSPEADRPQDHIILAPIANPRAAKVEDLLAAAHALDIPAHAAPHLAGALAQAHAITPPNGLIIATGSVYLVGAIRDLATAPPTQADQGPIA